MSSKGSAKRRLGKLLRAYYGNYNSFYPKKSVPIIDLVKTKTQKHIFSANHCHSRDKNAKKIAIDTTNESNLSTSAIIPTMQLS